MFPGEIYFTTCFPLLLGPLAWPGSRERGRGKGEKENDGGIGGHADAGSLGKSTHLL